MQENNSRHYPASLDAAQKYLFDEVARRVAIDTETAQLLKLCKVLAKTRNYIACIGPYGFAVVNRKNAKLYKSIDKTTLLAEADFVRHQVAVLMGLRWATSGEYVITTD